MLSLQGRTRGKGENSRDVDLLVLVLVKVPLDELLKVPQAHLPRPALLDLHVVELAGADAAPHVLLEAEVEEGAAAEAAGADGRLLDAQGLEGGDFVGDQAVRLA